MLQHNEVGKNVLDHNGVNLCFTNKKNQFTMWCHKKEPREKNNESTGKQLTNQGGALVERNTPHRRRRGKIRIRNVTVR